MPIKNDFSTQENYSPWVGLIYVFNLIVGTGALTLPAVFAKAGWLLSSILIIFLAFFGFVTVTFVIECISCANAKLLWTRIQSHRVDAESEVLCDTSTEEDSATEQTAIIRRTCRKYYSLNQRVELGEMAALYFNSLGRTLFFITLCIYLYGDLSIYAAAIAKTLSDLTCNSTQNTTESDDFNEKCNDYINVDKLTIYRFFVLAFALFVGPFSYFNIQKTKYLQILTSTMRWFSFTIMITIALIQLIKNGSKGSPPVFNFSGTPALVGASVYSFMCHHSLPGLVAPFTNKRFIIRQIALDYALICCFYIFIAITGSFAFANLYDLYTLNFVPSNLNIKGFFMKIIEYFLGFFPVFTLSTSFPIIAITLQNNLKSLFLDVNAISRHNFVIRRLTFPTLAIVPPIVVALLTHNIRSLVEFTGFFAGAAIQYIIPTIMVWCARRDCAKNICSVNFNKFASPFKGITWLIVVMCWSVTCVVFVIVNLLQY